MTTLLVTGGRVATVTQDYVDKVLDVVHAQKDVKLLIHGNAKGIDRMCGSWAKRRKIHVAAVDALWGDDGFGDMAGPIRNTAMLVLKPDLCVAFPGGAGTADMKRKVLRAKISLITAG